MPRDSSHATLDKTSTMLAMDKNGRSKCKFDSNPGLDYDNGSVSLSMQASPAHLFINAKRDDYWNKITEYNTRLHQLEMNEAKEKKKNDQVKLRDMLAEQLKTQKQNSNKEKELDKQFAMQQFMKQQADAEAENQKKLNYRKKLQDINKERNN